MANDAVAKRSAAVLAMAAEWDVIDPLLKGTLGMRAAGEKLMPKWTGEAKHSHSMRVSVATLFPAYARTVEVLTGKPFSKPLKLQDNVPSKIVDWADDIDLNGRNLHTFASDAFQMALAYGFGGILVEHFPKREGVVTIAQELAAGLRPYWVQLHPEQILGWQTTAVNGRPQLTQFRFMEYVSEPDGEFGEKTVSQVRVLTPGAWATYRRSATDPNDWVQQDEGVTTLPYIPFVPLYGQRLGHMRGKAPLVELAHMNVKHWQSQSDQDTILHIARVPILFAKGFEKKDNIVVGSGVAVKAPSVDSDLKYVEHTGAAIEAGKVSLDDLKEEMRQSGAELLVIKPGTITATQNANENAVGMCALQRMVESVQDALNLALQYTADFQRLDSGGECAIFNDFGATTLDDAKTQMLSALLAGGVISKQTTFEEAQRRDILSPDLTWEDEQGRIEDQGPDLPGLGAGPVDPVTGLPVRKPARTPPQPKPPGA